MWCDRCRADAAAEVSADTGRASCGTCGNDLGTVRRPATEQARELLKRWSVGIDLVTADDGLVSGSPDPIPAEPESETAAKEAPASPKADVATAEKRRVQRRRPSAPAPSPAATAPPPRRRIDAPHPGHSIGGGRGHSGFDGDTRIHFPHAGGPARPHFDVHTAIATQSERGGRGAQIIGQILAYSGVLALTIGTALVIWGYFGGPPDFAPTGWLVATGGQMLLFLGVVTLVAGGLEQTGRDVRVRVESLGERLIRIEQVAAGHGLNGPHMPPTGYARPSAHTDYVRERA